MNDQAADVADFDAEACDAIASVERAVLIVNPPPSPFKTYKSDATTRHSHG